MATRDRHGAAWMNNSHISCCSLQGLQEILSTIYRGEKDLTKVNTTGKIIILFYFILLASPTHKNKYINKDTNYAN